MQRVETAAGQEQARLWPVKLTALVHEIVPTELLTTLQHLGMADVAVGVTTLVQQFGGIWRVKDEAAMHEYVSIHRTYLEPLLLFEVAHEGTATTAMRTAAQLSGLDEGLAQWIVRLAVGRNDS